MFKIKLLVGLAALVTTLVVMTAPAAAEFSSTNGQTRGPIKTFPESSFFQATEGGPTIECKSASGEPKGEWIDQVKVYKKQGKYEYQEPSLTGPHEELKIDKWGHCVGPALIEAKVKCYLQVAIGGQNGSPSSSVNGTGGVYPNLGQTGPTGCEVFLGGENFCLIKVDPNGNNELGKVTLANAAGGGVEIGSEVSGITSTLQEKVVEAKGKCKEIGVASGQGTGKFKTKNPLVTEGQKLV